MRRFLYSALALSLILPLLGAAPAVRTRAESPIAAGKWTGYFERDMVITNEVGGVLIEATGNSKGDLTLQVDANGGITGTIQPYHAEIEWSASAVGVKGSCIMDLAWNITSGTVTENAAYLPVFDLQLEPTYYSAKCDPKPTSDATPSKNSAHFEALTYSGGKVTGDKVRFQTDQVEMVLSGLAQVGAKVSLYEHWELNSSGANVDVIEAEFVQYFLSGVPFENTYKAYVNWYNNPPGMVDFTLAGKSQKVPGEAEVSAVFDLGVVPAGKNPLVVTAYGTDGQPYGSMAEDVIVVPLEPWAQKANFAVGETKQDGIQNVVIYYGKTSIPEQPIELPYLDLTAIPVIGGKWGVPPFQVEVNLDATSKGGLSDPAPITGKANLFLGDDAPDMSMHVDGQAVTNLTESALLFDHGQLNFKMDPVSYEHNIGLVDLIPAAVAAYEIPGIGDALKAANSLAGVVLKFTVQSKGQGDLGVAADQSQLVFTNGNITPSVEVSASPGINLLQLIQISVGGGGKSVFQIRIAPTAGLENCWVSMSFTANIFGELYKSPDYSIAQCKQATLGGRKVLAVYLPAEYSSQLRLATRSQGTPRRTATYAQVPQTQGSTVLVSEAPPQAELDLALGPNGRMAFAYSTGQQGEIGLRLFDGQAWGEAIPLGETGRIHRSPVVGFDASGQVVVAWVQPMAGALSDINELEAFFRSWEIASAVVDGRGQVVHQGSLTQDDRPDFAPQLERSADGGLWLAWLQSPSANLWGPKDNPNWLKATSWDGQRWSSVETISKEIVGALGFRLAAGVGSNAAIVASLDTDGDPETIRDLEIYAFQHSGARWEAAQRFTDDTELDVFPLAAYTPEGDLVLAWQRGEAVVGLEGDLKGAPATWNLANQGQIPGLAGGELLAGAQGELAFLWASFTEDGQGVWLAQRRSSGEDWQPARPLVADLDGAGALSAQLAQDGSVWTGLAQLQVPTDEQELPGLGQVRLPGLPQSADLAVVGVPGVMRPLPENPPIVGGGSVKPSGRSNSTGMLLGGVAVLFALVVLGGGGMLWIRGKRRKRSQPAGLAGRR